MPATPATRSLAALQVPPLTTAALHLTTRATLQLGLVETLVLGHLGFSLRLPLPLRLEAQLQLATALLFATMTMTQLGSVEALVLDHLGSSLRLPLPLRCAAFPDTGRFESNTSRT